MKLKDILKNIQNENCGCGCHTCDISRSTKLINESTRLQISEDLQYHLDRNISLSENVFRIYSDKYFGLINEVRGFYI